MKCELYFAFDLLVLCSGVGLGYWLRSLCGRDYTLQEILEHDQEE